MNYSSWLYLIIAVIVVIGLILNYRSIKNLRKDIDEIESEASKFTTTFMVRERLINSLSLVKDNEFKSFNESGSIEVYAQDLDKLIFSIAPYGTSIHVRVNTSISEDTFINLTLGELQANKDGIVTVNLALDPDRVKEAEKIFLYLNYASGVIYEFTAAIKITVLPNPQ